MAQEPAVVIIARHGARLDAADQNWHLSTPTPYDPPLTYGGWNQCRALGVRIASLLHAREQSFNESTHEPPIPDGVRSRDFADQDGVSTSHESPSRKRKRRRHKVVVHSSPFLRCLQTSVAISAGMAQYQPGIGGSAGGGKSRSPSSMHSSSSRLKALDSYGAPSAGLMPIAEPRSDFAHVMARRALGEQNKRQRRSKMRVDAWLGEWLNPQYFDQITPPPPSAMMVATAKGELIQNEQVDAYVPTVSARASAAGSLWGGSGASNRSMSNDSSLDDWEQVQDSLPAPAARRDRASSVNSASSSDSASASGRRSPFRHGHASTSAVPKSDSNVYNPPTPHYAVSNSDNIPRGYTAHARNATVNVDYQWDSSRQPQNWGDGGKLGEEWSSMHKRFRRGLNHLVDWYGHHGVDDRAEDAMGFDQADKHTGHDDDSEEQEDLVVVLVTHGAGSNALIGALTGQPVLLDVGMASLTMAVRKDDAPSLRHVAQHSDANLPNGVTTNGDRPKLGHRKTSSQDTPLSALYDMKLVASSEHLRPGTDPSRPLTSLSPIIKDAGGNAFRSFSTTAVPATTASSNANDRSQSALLGSIRRPSKLDTTTPPNLGATAGGLQRRSTEPRSGVDHESPVVVPAIPPSATSPSNSGLWTPAGAATRTNGTEKEERRSFFSTLEQGENEDGQESSNDLVLGFSTSPFDSRPTSPNKTSTAVPTTLDGASDHTHSDTQSSPNPTSPTSSSSSTPPATADGTVESEQDALPDLPAPGDKVPAALRRGLSQKGLWGSKPKGAEVLRNRELGPKRRWTLVGGQK